MERTHRMRNIMLWNYQYKIIIIQKDCGPLNILFYWEISQSSACMFQPLNNLLYGSRNLSQLQ